MTALLTPDEEARLATLASMNVLDTRPEREFDGIVEVVRALLDVPIALVSLVDRDRQWFKAKVGIDLCETSRDIAFCAHAICGTDPLVVPDATLDARFALNPLVTGAPGVRFYAGAPIVVEGQALGTVCGIDLRPREVEARTIAALATLANQAAALLLGRQREANHAERERRLVAFLDHSPALTFLKDAEGRKRFSNRRHQELFGDKGDEGMPAEILQAARANDEVVRRTGEPLMADECRPLLDGSPRVWQVLKFALEVAGETWIGGVAVDVTAQRAAETTVRQQGEELTKRNAELEAREGQLSWALAEAEAAKARHAQVEARFGAFFDHAPVGAFMKDAQGRYRFSNDPFNRVVGRDSAAIIKATDHDLFPASAADGFQAADAEVRRTGRPLEIEEDVPMEDGGVERWLTLKFPVVIDGETWVGGVGMDVTALREAEARIRDQNAELRQREEALTTALQDAETSHLAAQMAATRFEQLFDGLPVACFTYGEGGTIYEWNAAAAHLWGIAAEEALLAPVVGTAVGEAHRAAQEAIDGRVFAGETVRGVERRETMRDGRERWLLTSTFPLRTPVGTIVGAVGASLDVTERKRAEEEMREAKQFAEGMAESSTSMLYLVDCDTRIQIWSNRNVAEALGYDAETMRLPGDELLPRIVHPDDLARMLAHGEEFHDVRDGQVIDFEARFRHASGEWRWFWHRETVYKRKADGSPSQIMGTAQDVTERKRMEADLRASEARFRTVVESLHEGLTVQNESGQVLLWNPSAQRIIGADITGSNASDGLGTAWRLVREDGTAYEPEEMPIPRALRTGEPQESVVVGVETAGGTQWLSVNAAPLASGSDGGTREAVSSFVDVTERKRMEAALRESEARFRTAVESLHEGLVVMDGSGAIELWNRGAERILGLTGDQLSGRTSLDPRWRTIHEDGSEFPGEEHPSTRALTTGKAQEPATMGVHQPDGVLRWIEVNAAPVCDAEGRTQSVVASFVDITERLEHTRRIKAYSDDLETANVRLEALATTDGLTGLKNHRFFQDWLRRRIDQSVGGLSLSIALLDVDRFKLYNDDFGHQAGDAVLRGVAKALESSVRAGDLVARYGGEEFVLVLPGADEAEAVAIAERVRLALAELPFPDRAVTASFGVATLGGGLSDAPSMIRAADEALYRSKNAGRNRVTHCRELGMALEAA